MDSERFTWLSEQQRNYLRQAFQHRNSQEIAFEAKVSSRAVDKKILLANDISTQTRKLQNSFLAGRSAPHRANRF